VKFSVPSSYSLDKNGEVWMKAGVRFRVKFIASGL